MLELINRKWINATIHIFVVVIYSMLVFTGPMGSDLSNVAIELTIRSLILNAFVYYLNTYFLLPNLLSKNRYLLYTLTTLTVILVIAFINKYFGHFFHFNNFHPNIPSTHMGDDFMNDPGFSIPNGKPMMIRDDFMHSGPHFFMSSISTLGILFLSTIFWLIIESDKRNKREMTLMNENLRTEMKFLKSQINPHFLFNVLNNVYALSVTQSEKTPDMILKLSDMLRFVLYESEDKKVKLGREVSYIDNYIEFQKIKIEGEARIALNMKEINKDLMIEPMLLIPFVENSFKHSKIEDIKNSWMRIDLRTIGSTVYFMVENYLPISSMSKDKVGGIGIENVIKRLNHLYPLKHKLKIDVADNRFVIELIIQTK